MTRSFTSGSSDTMKTYSNVEIVEMRLGFWEEDRERSDRTDFYFFSVKNESNSLESLLQYLYIQCA